MASDDVLYALAALSSVTVGLLFRQINGVETRRLISTFSGVLLLSSLCGRDCLHFVITVAGNCILLSHPLLKLQCHRNSFIWNFGYLVVFRTIHYVGLPAPSSIANAAQLFLTLRMIGLSWDIYDTRCLHQSQISGGGDTETIEEAEHRRLEIRYKETDPSIKDIICFAFCYIGALTGPYYKYHVYRDWLRQIKQNLIPLSEPFVSRAKFLPVMTLIYGICSYFFSIQYVKTDEFYENPFWFRLFYMVPMFILFRTRLYAAWILSECMCITAGLGAYPKVADSKCGQGPLDLKAYDQVEEKEGLKYDFETIHNIDIWGCELAPTTKQGLRSWNMTVQYWLATYIHRRVPLSLKPFRVSITMGVSAFWHGIHPGYYLSFLTVPPILMAEEAMIRAFHYPEASKLQKKVFDWGCWFFKMRGFDYNCMGFLLLRLDATLRYWKSIYFIGHIVIAAFYLLGTTCKMLRPKKKGDVKVIDETVVEESQQTDSKRK